MHGNLKEEYFNFVFQPYLEADQTISGITIIGNEVTEQVIAKAKIQEKQRTVSSSYCRRRGILWTNNARRNGAARLGFTHRDKLMKYQGYGWTNAVPY
jgi:hypothetical protein